MPTMPMTQQRDQHQDIEEHKRQTLKALIVEQVIHVLGKPEGLHQVQVRPLWENYYRVNLFIGKDAASVTIANSYFLKTDGDGNILESTPKIVRKTGHP